MAIFRESPKCPFCKEIIAKAVIDTESKVIGDNFIRWDYFKHTCKNIIMKQMRTKEFYENKANGKKVNPFFEYDTPRMYVVEFDTGMTHEVMATSARDAKLKTLHLQPDYGYYKTAYQKNMKVKPKVE